MDAKATKPREAAQRQEAVELAERLPLPLGEGLRREGTRSLREITPDQLRKLPARWQKFEVTLADGNSIQRVAKRLKPLRGIGGGLLGGKALVVMKWSTGLAIAVHVHPDGDASERRLIAGLLSPLRDLTV